MTDFEQVVKDIEESEKNVDVEHRNYAFPYRVFSMMSMMIIFGR